ncbi:MAG: flagellar biosynthesis protein FlgA [Candidatus Wallbacteria bacterium HGW-Wallbacteria-1]|uniref:Flagellar P-ring protein n=1 Tax=Candidatus Wallbacteria bacterium HGW-Wallbacteria-1 TaxID=2013854 RepID=A0A2N1PU41_9BACT|nr:MAG: flagellar biosynthesis protein FlgA [Candidatus Wallbacteria bacterium HGW-Wallbacteria-1]
MKNPGKFLLLMLILLSSLCVSQDAALAEAPRVRLKDIARVRGVRANQLMGRGIVVGLDGTGDKLLLSAQMIANMLSAFNTSFSRQDLKTKNVAAVMVTATLPPFSRSGDQIDVSVASLADAKSLRGGILLTTPLVAADGNVYAVAQGPVTVGEGSVLTAGLVPGGAIVEREVPSQLVTDGRISVILDKKDFTTANRVKAAVNTRFGEGRAKALDSGTVDIEVPVSFRDNVVGFISSLEDLLVVPDSQARVVLNERTGTVVMGQNVRISSVAISHGTLTVTVGGGNQRVLSLDSAGTVDELVGALNAVGATPRDLVAIMQALQRVGALHADLNIM